MSECPDPRDDDNLIHLTPNRLWAILALVWLIGLLVAAGVSWIAAGIESDNANRAIAKASQTGLNVLYTQDGKRCEIAFTTRKIAIHNALIQARTQPGVIIPPAPKPCSETVKDPNHPASAPIVATG